MSHDYATWGSAAFMFFITVNAASLVSRLIRLIKHSPYEFRSPTANRICDALAVISGIACIAWIVSAAPRYGGFDWSVWMLIGVLGLNVMLSIACTMLMDHALKKEGMNE